MSPLTMEHMHLQVTVAVMDGESTADALKYAQDQVEAFYKDVCKSSAPSEYEPNMPTISVEQPVKSQSVSLLQQIESCTELKVLESYRLIAKANSETQKSYDNTLNKIQNG